jgi:site-specific recombinase XerD
MLIGMAPRPSPATTSGRTDQSSDRFRRLAAAWLAGLSADRTRAAYGGDLDRFRGWLESRGIVSPLAATSRQVDRFRESLECDGEAASTMARRMSALRSFYRFVTAHGEIAASPSIAWSGGPDTDARVGLDADDMADVLASAGRLGSRTAALVGLMIVNGMRLDEVLACDAADVSIRPRSVSIALTRRDGTPSVVVDRWTAAALRRYLGDRRDGPLLFGESPTRRADRLTRFGADYLIKRVGANAGIDPPLSANSLRRTFVAQSHAGGMPLPEIRDRLGHRDVRTTRRHVDRA